MRGLIVVLPIVLLIVGSLFAFASGNSYSWVRPRVNLTVINNGGGGNISDTNETVRVNNIVGFNCSNTEFVRGRFNNGTAICGTDQSGGTSVKWSLNYSVFANYSDVLNLNYTFWNAYIETFKVNASKYADVAFTAQDVDCSNVSGTADDVCVDDNDNTQRVGDDVYLYNDSTTMFLNETKLNDTIDDRDDDTQYFSGDGVQIGINNNISFDCSEVTDSGSDGIGCVPDTEDLFILAKTGLTADTVGLEFDCSDVDGENIDCNGEVLNVYNSSILGVVTNASLDFGDGNTQRSGDNVYLYNDSTTMFLNETKLNYTITNLSGSVADTNTQRKGDNVYLYNDTDTIYLNESKLNYTISNFTSGIDTTIGNCSAEGSCGLITYDTELDNATIVRSHNTSWILNNQERPQINTSGVSKGSVNMDFNDIFNVKTFTSNQYNATNFLFNYYDDGSELFMNVSSVTDAFNVETENSKIVLFNEPSAGNDWKVFQIFSKEGVDQTEFIIHKAGANRAAFNARSFRIGGNASSTCDALTALVDCNTSSTGADLVVQDEGWFGGTVYIAGNYSANLTLREDGDVIGRTPYFDNWTDVSITRSQVTDYVEIDISDYHNFTANLLNYTNLSICSESEILKVSSGQWICSSDATGAGGSQWPLNYSVLRNESGTLGINDSYWRTNYIDNLPISADLGSITITPSETLSIVGGTARVETFGTGNSIEIDVPLEGLADDLFPLIKPDHGINTLYIDDSDRINISLNCTQALDSVNNYLECSGLNIHLSNQSIFDAVDNGTFIKGAVADTRWLLNYSVFRNDSNVLGINHSYWDVYVASFDTDTFIGNCSADGSCGLITYDSELAYIPDTNASTACSGTTTYLDGEGNCDTLDDLGDFANDGYLKNNTDSNHPELNVTNTLFVKKMCFVDDCSSNMTWDSTNGIIWYP